ncbi:Sulfite exporter TauE/SafE [Rubripirellula lacrimiformis]|uniref:Probable membrane transporter protein n=1 Tax=Rubripirellula lacrimiformis TaxID=1930273 RepID=A0A517N7T5_9BACT|nr:TSUP family transporter [Rubripirellula lacrimiformis]QDT03191.1 Sulfite exporter TauE/SafE [Rubripirellula lacrimiformis]
MDEWISLLPITMILCFGIFVQSAAGFAAGLLIVPALLWCGYTIPAAQAAMLVATIPQNVWGVWSLRDSISPRRVVWPALARVLFLPVGVMLLYSMESLPTDSIRQIVGGVVLAATLAIMWFNPVPRSSLHPIWAWLAFPVSGFLQGVVGMGGPVMVFWVQAHDWDSKQTRGFLFTMYLISIIPALAILYIAFGDRIVAPAVSAAASIPVLWLSAIMGLRFGTWLGTERLRRLTLVLLLLLGVSGVTAPWWR